MNTGAVLLFLFFFYYQCNEALCLYTACTPNMGRAENRDHKLEAILLCTERFCLKKQTAKQSSTQGRENIIDCQ